MLFRLRSDLAEIFDVTLGRFFRRALGLLTGWFPFSLFEIILGAFIVYALFALILCLVMLIRKIRKKPSPRWQVRCAVAVPVTLGIVLQLFAATLGPSYFRTGTAKHMALDTESVAEEDVFRALERVSRVINETAPHLEKNEAGETLGKTLAQCRGDVRRAADAFGAKHAFFQAKGSEVKFLLCSPWMTYTHLSGVYGFFTGEANVNTNYPHFIVTATAAHESCHARGIAPENECNFLAAVILMESDDPYLRYCGAAFVLDDLIAACRKSDRDRTDALLARTDRTVFLDYDAYSRFFEPYADNPAADAANAVNDSYLKSLGQEGVVSYSRIVELLAAYYR
ncbi:MAG: DUF3810 domain-containing protein [Clostridia bacterium]|nr:DUF3810 domain-containing protein [Clostridia bacterium]